MNSISLMLRVAFTAAWLGTLISTTGCRDTDRAAVPVARNAVLRLAVTTSTRDSGLTNVLLPAFEQQHNARIDLIAVGTGQAIRLAESGEVDVILVHAPESERRFMAAGHGSRHEPIMQNSFELIGPADDPAQIHGLVATDALKQISFNDQRFVSRGDDSGTHKRELAMWAAVGGPPKTAQYIEAGRGMGATLIMAHQMKAYTLTDRGTRLAIGDRIDLVPLITSGKELRNRYAAMTVHPGKNNQINGELADRFLDFLISAEAQKIIGEFAIAGKTLFEPLRLKNS